jgi:hypothetical protein
LGSGQNNSEKIIDGKREGKLKENRQNSGLALLTANPEYLLKPSLFLKRNRNNPGIRFIKR